MVESIKNHKKDKSDLTVPLEIELDEAPNLAEDGQRINPSTVHDVQYNGTPINEFDDHDCARQ